MTTTLDGASASTYEFSEIDTPVLPVMQLIAHPGTNPTMTFPIVGGGVVGVEPDVDAIAHHLAEPAQFFGIPIPSRRALSAALAEFARAAAARAGRDVVAASVTLLHADGRTRVVVTGELVEAFRRDAVRIAGCDAPVSTPRRTDPHWRRMAARTTSMGEADQLRRWLDGRGYVDAVATTAGSGCGAPFLGALVFDTGTVSCGLENPEPTSVLHQLERCGVIEHVERVDVCPEDAERAWWISPMFETHPVERVDQRIFRPDMSAPPPFARRR